MALRSWMEANEITRQSVADHLGITKGHYSTLINANRGSTEAHCHAALLLMDRDPEDFAPAPLSDSEHAHEQAAKKKSKRKAKKAKKAAQLRPLTEFESKFVTDVATSWINANRGASPEETVKVVKALSTGIRG